MKKRFLPAIAAAAALTVAGWSYTAQAETTPLNFQTSYHDAASKHLVAYLLLNDDSNLAAIAKNPSQYKFTRLVLSFADPHLNFDGTTLKNTGLFNGMTTLPDLKTVQAQIAAIKAAGKEVYLSVGGWDYSMGGDGNTDDSGFNPSTGSDDGYLYFKTLLLYPGTTESPDPNYPVDASGNCKLYESDQGQKPSLNNNWCHVVEPPTPGQSQKFSSFPYPVGYAGKLPAGVKVPATDYYKNLVTFAQALGVDGIDVDYEELWAADWYRQDFTPSSDPKQPGTLSPNYDRTVDSPEAFGMPMAVDKYAAILSAIEKDAGTSLKISTAAPAVGAIPIDGPWASGKQWWGGNLKGLIYNTAKQDPAAIKGLTGGIGVMSYDLSSAGNNPPFAMKEYAPLAKQVAFYMNSYLLELATPNVGGLNLISPANIYLGVEIGNPAFPKQASAQLPLMQVHSTAACGEVFGGCNLDEVLSKNISLTPPSPSVASMDRISDYWKNSYNASDFGGMILWEQFKSSTAPQASVDDVENYYFDNFVK